MKRKYSLFIKDIINSIERIEEFTEDYDFEKFKNDDKTSSAVIRKLEMIGEAAKNIPKDYYQRFTGPSLK